MAKTVLSSLDNTHGSIITQKKKQTPKKLGMGNNAIHVEL